MRGGRQFLRAWRVWVVVTIALVGSICAGNAATFYTLVTNGPASNRLCIVFLSEGYTSSQTNTFLTDCTNALHSYFGGGAYSAEEPFAEYSNYFNIYAVFTNSVSSGSSHPQYGLVRTNRRWLFSTACMGICDRRSGINDRGANHYSGAKRIASGQARFDDNAQIGASGWLTWNERKACFRLSSTGLYSWDTCDCSVHLGMGRT